MGVDVVCGDGLVCGEGVVSDAIHAPLLLHWSMVGSVVPIPVGNISSPAWIGDLQ